MLPNFNTILVNATKLYYESTFLITLFIPISVQMPNGKLVYTVKKGQSTQILLNDDLLDGIYVCAVFFIPIPAMLKSRFLHHTLLKVKI